MKTVTLSDFRGGYATDVPSYLLSENELLEATNCEWRDGLRTRKGIQTYATTDFSGTTIQGMFRAKFDSGYETLVAVDDGGSVVFWAGETLFTSLSEPGWEPGYKVDMAQLGDWVLAVNGYNKPIVITKDGGSYTFETIESRDERVREDFRWKAGEYDGSSYSDSTDPLQDDSLSAQLFDGSANHGFYVACEFTFNKVTFTGLSGSGSYNASVEYWDGSQWVSATVVQEPDWTSASEQILEIDFPISNRQIDWDLRDEPGVLSGRYALRVTFDGGSSFDADTITASHSQYLTMVTAGVMPHLVEIDYNGRPMLAAGSVLHLGLVNQLTGWLANYVELFEQGGSKIMSLVPGPGGTIVFKESAIYALSGNSFQNYTRIILSTDTGTIAPRSVVVSGEQIFFLSEKGIEVWTGNQSVILSKHIASDVTNDTDAAGVSFNGRYYLSFPSDSYTIHFDPDTIRRTDTGDGRASMYKYTNYGVYFFIHCNGSGDHGWLLGVRDGTSIVECETGSDDDGVAIEMVMQTPFLSFAGGGFEKAYGRLKPELGNVGAYILRVESDDGQRSADIPLSSASPAPVFTDDITLPYFLDGKNISVRLTGESYGAWVRAVHMQFSKRSY